VASSDGAPGLLSQALQHVAQRFRDADLPSLPPMALPESAARLAAAASEAGAALQSAVLSADAALHSALPSLSSLPSLPALSISLRSGAEAAVEALSSGDPTTLAAASVGLAATAALVAARGEDEPSSSDGELRFLRYDPEYALTYFSRRPGKALLRGAEVARLAGGWLAALALDRLRGRESDNAPSRAAQLRSVLTALGPAAVKVGQVLSARVDLLPPAYLQELRKLQDSVAPFPEPLARAILERELPSGAFAFLSPVPVASASLGQVYKGTLAADGRTVAVKVQRPDVAEGITLDLLILRLGAPLLQRRRGLNTDLVALVDEWGSRFVDELDYTKEAAAGSAFRAAMEARGLGASITAAEVVAPLSSRRVLTTAWVEGTRLDATTLDAPEARRMVELAVAAYLTMLLDTGSLHADPHPGNLLRTPDGALCILDWGLITPVTQPQQYAILSYIAHLVGKDYGAVAADLAAMDFVPRSKIAALNDSGVVTVLADVFRALAKGGGAKQVSAELKEMNIAKGGRVDALAKDIAYVQETYGNILQIPSYFAYILRAFSVLEGIGLRADPAFSIAQSAYPYVARRLLSDPSDKAQRALEGILYGPEGADGPLDARRVKQLAVAFRAFSDTTRGAAAQKAQSPEVGAGTLEALRMALAPSGGPLQRVLLRELAKVAGAAAAVGVDAAAATVPGRAAASAWAAQRAAFDGGTWPARFALAPLTLPADVLAFAAPLVRKRLGDEARLEAARQVMEAVFGSPDTTEKTTAAGAEDGAERARKWVAAAAPLLPELAPGIAAAAMRFGAVCMEQAAARIAAADKEDRAGKGNGVGTAPPRV
jgi:predicted unusual protein kinase regulating ubiquinone biosynthesis (AarF/ABC1/UbiB family)